MPSKTKSIAARRPSRVKAKPGKSKRARVTGKSKRPSTTKTKASKVAAKPAFLAGGNPQIAKGDGNAPVQAYFGHTGLEARHRTQPRRAHRAHRPESAQSHQVELALLRHRRSRLVRRFSIASRST